MFQGRSQPGLRLEDLHANEAWPYFDTFNLHHYESFNKYPQLYADFRARASAGRPLWVSECTDAGAVVRRRQGPGTDRRRSASTIGTSPSSFRRAPCTKVGGHVLLPVAALRGGTNPIRHPASRFNASPAFLALGTVGRLLADARPLGRLRPANDSIQATFSRKTRRWETNDLVAWSKSKEATLILPVKPQAVFDHLGRTQPISSSLVLHSAPLFVLFPPGVARSFFSDSTSRPAPKPLPGPPARVVFQAIWPEKQVDLRQSAYRCPTGTRRFPCTSTISAKTKVQGDAGSAGSPPAGKPGFPQPRYRFPEGRIELRLMVEGRQAAPKTVGTLRLQGDFGPAGKPVFSLRAVSFRSGDFTGVDYTDRT